jgi:phosphoribosylglycinamide formyltransferase-1
VRDALAAGVSETGCTVHLATLEMDAGPILAQRGVPVLPDDTDETLHERIKVVERELYPETVAWALGELEAGRRIGPMRNDAVGSGVGTDKVEEKKEAWTRG